ncbi:phosphocholine cytidylyltransferase family protein [Polyangium jinanense]|uniref:NTP transferase domain-containing protein n=1 Tax=Polyangium jinanense TaxID=2829994 RepID=A0A9X4AR93_9BACT|nr:NTP transferase domain-containing protein [Polyangium jinanense]MDC3954185.1 NTP transferase domain-containing protein [Polyangium jinanense]MDC3981859.1 NTP transferase domain-containing protein [Polyangium jinanense]
MLEKQTMERAIVLAAGTGSRLVSGEIAPKPLKPVAGVPLLVRILRTLRAEGIREVVVVTGYKEELIRGALAESSLGLSISFVSNTQYERKNGVSLLAAREHVVPGTLLTMADHLYAPAIVRRLAALDLPSRAAALAVDYDIPRCFDLDDATKVRVERGRIVDIGKEIPAYDALDTGVFRIGPSLVEALDRVYAAKGDCSLSEGVRALADEGMFFACDAGDARWIDVDTPAALEQAELLLRMFGDGLDRDVYPRPSERVAPVSRSWAAGYQPAADAE